MHKFKIGDKVIVKSSIGSTNEVVEIEGRVSHIWGYKLRTSNNIVYFEDELVLWNPKTDLEGGYMKQELKLEVGKKYRSRDGEIIKISGLNRNPIFPFSNEFGNSFRANGESKVNYHYDLIEEVKDDVEMKEISMDKKYRTRDGRDVEIIAIRKDFTIPVIYMIKGCTVVHQCAINGRRFIDAENYYNTDLIEVNPYADFKVDDKVIVWDNSVGIKYRAYFAGVNEQGMPLAWDEGQTSWSTKDNYNYTTAYDNCVKWDGTDD